MTLDAGSYDLTSNAQIRFQCDASGNGDRIYIDDVSVTGRCNGTAGRSAESSQSLVELKSPTSLPVQVESDELEDDPNLIKLSPNPTVDLLNLQVDKSLSIQAISIRAINGALISHVDIDQNLEMIDVSQLTAGVYVMSIKTEDSVINKLFVKM